MQDADGPADAEDDECEIDLSQSKKERDFLVDLFPFAHPVEFCTKKCHGGCGASAGVGYIVGFSASSHPALPLACRLMGSDCFMSSDWPRQRSINHSQIICEDYLLKKAMAELHVPVKRRLQIGKLQFIDVGKLDPANQAVE